MAEQRKRSATTLIRDFPENKKRWKEAAKIAGEEDLSTWLRKVINKEADALLRNKPRKT
jgi:hypothetical protein